MGKTGISAVSPVYQVQSSVTLCSATGGVPAVWAHPAVARQSQDGVHCPVPAAPADDGAPVAGLLLLRVLRYKFTKHRAIPFRLKSVYTTTKRFAYAKCAH